MRSSSREKLINLNRPFKGFRDADKIIAWLSDPDSESPLPKKIKDNYDRYVVVYGLRMRHKQHSFIINYLKDQYGRSERQARYDIAESEYIFGKVIRVDRAFEVAFLIEMSRKNIELAMSSKNVKNISMALKQHMEILGPETDQSLLPDFSNFEPHKYNIVLPKGLPEQLMSLIQTGAINLSEVMPSRMIKFLDESDVQDVESE